jgi:phytoene dehydrogenase-like protein
MAEPDSVRASDTERDAEASRLQAAFAEGRLGDTEFDERMRAALTARTRTDLARLMTDLPAEAPAPLPVPAGRQPGRFAVTFKSSLRRAGRWRVPDRLTTVVYKGEGLLDLRAAELTAPVTTISAVAYKSRIDILVPPGVRVEAGGMGVSTGTADPETPLSPNAPVVHVRGYSYKGTVEVAGRPGEG